MGAGLCHRLTEYLMVVSSIPGCILNELHASLTHCSNGNVLCFVSLKELCFEEKNCVKSVKVSLFLPKKNTQFLRFRGMDFPYV